MKKKVRSFSEEVKPSPEVLVQHWVCCNAGWTLEQWAFYRYQLHLGWTNIAGLLFVNLYFYLAANL